MATETDPANAALDDVPADACFECNDEGRYTPALPGGASCAAHETPEAGAKRRELMQRIEGGK